MTHPTAHWPAPSSMPCGHRGRHPHAIRPRASSGTATQIFRRLVAGFISPAATTPSNDTSSNAVATTDLLPTRTPAGSSARSGLRAYPSTSRRPAAGAGLVTTWSYSNCPFAIRGTERTGAVLHGLVEAFTFFGCVPASCGGTTRTVAVRIHRGRDPQLTHASRRRRHYVFAPACMPATPTETPPSGSHRTRRKCSSRKCRSPAGCSAAQPLLGDGAHARGDPCPSRRWSSRRPTSVILRVSRRLAVELRNRRMSSSPPAAPAARSPHSPPRSVRWSTDRGAWAWPLETQPVASGPDQVSGSTTALGSNR